MTMDRSEEDGARALQELSAVADGEADAVALASACAAWRADDGLRASWHVYHLIGDVMRSDELASDARRDRPWSTPSARAWPASRLSLAPPCRRRLRHGLPGEGVLAYAGSGCRGLHRGGRCTPCDQRNAAHRRAAGHARAIVRGASNRRHRRRADGAEPALLVADGQLIQTRGCSAIWPRTSSSTAVPRSVCRRASCVATTQVSFDR